MATQKKVSSEKNFRFIAELDIRQLCLVLVSYYNLGDNDKVRFHFGPRKIDNMKKNIGRISDLNRLLDFC